MKLTLPNGLVVLSLAVLAWIVAGGLVWFVLWLGARL